MLKRTEVISFLVIAAGIYYLHYLQRDTIFFLYGLAEVFLYFVFFLVFIYAVYRALKASRDIPLMKRLLPLFIGVAFAGSFFLAGHIANTDGGKTIIMSAGHNGDLNFLDLDLRDDNTFKLKNVGPFGGTIHRGKYTFWNDTLMLDDDIDGLYPGGKFVVRMNDENRKYFDPLGRDSTKYAYRLYISKSSRGVAE